jgi:hypothetical protein
MARPANARGTSPAAAASLGKDDVVSNATTAAKTQETSGRVTGLRALHVEIVRGELAKGPIPLTLTSDDRWRWGQRGLTLKERDDAAAALVRWGEAEYCILKDRRHPYENAVHLVAGGER